nr:EOG090X013U [Eurycercus lamellatus]
MTDSKEEPDDYVYYGNSLAPLEEDEIGGKKPIRIEDQEVRDENGRRRFHGAFTGGFSAGYYNTVDTKEGWRPSEFKSSRSDRKKHQQKPEDYMDQEDLGSFGIAPQVLRAKDDFGENQASRKQLKPIFAPRGPIPGIPALHDLFHPVKETIGIKLLRSMGWKPHQGAGERLTKREKKERKKREERLKAYTVGLPPGYKQQDTSDGESDDESDQLFAPDDVPTYVVQPKTNTFGLGYSGLMPRDKAPAKSGFVLFEPTLSLTDRKKKLQIAGQAFGVGAFEKEDEDIYAKDDMSQYDFELGGAKTKKPSSQLLALPSSDLLDGFVRAIKSEPIVKFHPLPSVPRDFVPIHRSQQSRFDVKPMSEAEFRGLGRHDLDAFQRAALFHELLDGPESHMSKEEETPHQIPQAKPTPAEVVAQALAQIRQRVAAQQEIKSAALTDQKPKIHDPAVELQKEAKIADLKAFIQKSLTISSFQPFSRDPAKQYRFDAFNVEFERSLTLYRPLTGTMQNRFTSGGHVEENIQGGLVAQIENFLPEEAPRIKKEPVEKDPAKRAARRKHFGPLTRKYNQWKPDRLLCIRFNVPNPFPDAGASHNSAKLIAKGSGTKFSIFDVLSSNPTPSFISTGFENVPPGPVQGPANQVKELEWDKAERGELEETNADVLQDVVTVKTEIQTSDVAALEDEAPYQRPPMDLFKAIFEDSESEEEEIEEVVKKETEATVANPVKPIVDIEEMDEEFYGPRLPSSVPVKAAVLVPVTQETHEEEEWVEVDKEVKKKKDKKNKKNKKKDKKSKKRKRRHSDASSDEDMKILKKIVALKKQQKFLDEWKLFKNMESRTNSRERHSTRSDSSDRKSNDSQTRNNEDIPNDEILLKPMNKTTACDIGNNSESDPLSAHLKNVTEPGVPKNAGIDLDYTESLECASLHPLTVTVQQVSEECSECQSSFDVSRMVVDFTTGNVSNTCRSCGICTVMAHAFKLKKIKS